MTTIIVYIVVAVIALGIGILAGYIIRKSVGEKAIGSAEQKAKNLILDAENRSETIRKEYILEAKEEAHKLRSDADREIRERRSEISKSERRLIQKEESIDRKLENIEKKEESITNKEQSIISKQKELDHVINQQNLRLFGGRGQGHSAGKHRKGNSVRSIGNDQRDRIQSQRRSG